MNCQHCQKHLHLHQLTSTHAALPEVIQTHLYGCAACSTYWQKLNTLIEQLPLVPVALPTEEQWHKMHASILSAVAVTKKPSNKQHATPFRRAVPLGRLAALFFLSVTLAGSLMLVSRYQHHTHSGMAASAAPTDFPQIVSVQGEAYESSSLLFGLLPHQVALVSKQAIINKQPIWTGKKGSINIAIDKQSSIIIKSRTRAIFDTCTALTQHITLDTGTLVAQVGKKLHGQHFQIKTANALCEVVGTRFKIVTTFDHTKNQHITAVSVFEGTVRFGTGSNTHLIRSGYQSIAYDDSLSPIRALQPTVSTDSITENRFFSVTSTPTAALVTLDDSVIGITPCTGKAVRLKHRLKISKEGYLPFTHALNFTVDSLVNLQAVLVSAHPPALTVKQKQGTSDNGFLARSEQLLGVGSFRNALSTLDSVQNEPDATANEKAEALNKTALCYKQLGKIDSALIILNRIVAGPFSEKQRGSALFQIASLQYSQLHNLAAAVTAYKQYIEEYRNGIWTEEAYLTLAELYLIQKDFTAASLTYTAFIGNYPQSPQLSSALFGVATLYAHHLNNCSSAIPLFTQLLTEFSKNEYSEDALFWRADCLYREGRISQSLAEYNNYLATYPNGTWVQDTRNRLRKNTEVGER